MMSLIFVYNRIEGKASMKREQRQAALDEQKRIGVEVVGAVCIINPSS